MYMGVLNKLVLMLGFAVAVASFAWNMATGGDLLYSAFVALCVLFASSTVFLIALRGVAQVLFKHLKEKRIEQARAAQERARQEREERIRQQQQQQQQQQR